MATSKITKYMRLKKVQALSCAGKALKSTVTAAAKAYVDDAVKKGKTKAEAEAIAKRVTSTCDAVSGRKKATKRKAAVKGVRATVAKVGRPRKKK